MFAAEVVRIKAVHSHELSVPISQRTAWVCDVLAWKWHDDIKDGVFIHVLFGQRLDFRLDPHSFLPFGCLGVISNSNVYDMGKM